jgi:hypothetical protein
MMCSVLESFVKGAVRRGSGGEVTCGKGTGANDWLSWTAVIEVTLLD